MTLPTQLDELPIHPVNTTFVGHPENNTVDNTSATLHIWMILKLNVNVVRLGIWPITLSLNTTFNGPWMDRTEIQYIILYPRVDIIHLCSQFSIRVIFSLHVWINEVQIIITLVYLTVVPDHNHRWFTLSVSGVIDVLCVYFLSLFLA